MIILHGTGYQVLEGGTHCVAQDSPPALASAVLRVEARPPPGMN